VSQDFAMAGELIECLRGFEQKPAASATLAARRTLYCEYDVPVKVGMSFSVLASARKMSESCRR
jgi:hypothetical protein